MLENDFTPANRHPKMDASQINEHLDNMSIDELTDALTDMWDATDDLSYSTDWMDECLERIEQVENAPDFDADASLEKFLGKHSRLVECASRASENSRAKTSRWKSPVAAVVAILVVLGSMVTVQAVGIDVFGAIARWTNETFHFASSPQNGNTLNTDTQSSSSHALSGKYSSLQDALDACGIKLSIVPRWLPDGFEFVYASVSIEPSPTSIRAKYTSDDCNFSLIVFQYESPDAIDYTVFEKDTAEILRYEKHGITYYIMTNNTRLTAAWMPEDQIVCSIVGDLSVDEVKQIIDSM